MAQAADVLASDLRDYLEKTRRDTARLNSLELRTFETTSGTVVPIYLHSADSSAYGTGELLVDVDREFRRAIAILGGRTQTPSRTRSNLQVVAAKQGNSIDVAFAAYSMLANVVLSDPLQLLMSFEWLWDRRPSRWGTRKSANPRTFASISKRLLNNAAAATNAGYAIAISLEYDADGSMRTIFVAAPPTLPPEGPIRPQ